uniref:Uncharacterized protein n=1 Tax=Arundo donax TaxID=35708 RepID=A0A0A9HCY4_ARUDO
MSAGRGGSGSSASGGGGGGRKGGTSISYPGCRHLIFGAHDAPRLVLQPKPPLSPATAKLLW